MRHLHIIIVIDTQTETDMTVAVVLENLPFSKIRYRKMIKNYAMISVFRFFC